MNANINRPFHPLRVDSDAIHALAHWLKENGSRQIRQPDLCSLISARYPLGLFSDDEVQVLCELLQNQ
ncbi:hypothetical protein PUN49_14880 [Pseudomonas extremaustralis]|uniref:hypothetical protein n=1 Tax=Pseudomonas TaxID=286 RepID=UPI0021C7F7E3|nr:hypothetical protein [Pseudomonas extremaustralis]MDB1109241.1 hypothetical protein [Pseudomonas extremaustralis]MDG2968316.1 hypothetical protein [Pseudomonas extremaustralis]UUJ43272.1 hypothetical protein L1A22_13635 [Pseudomonas extremaustralis]